MNDKLVDLVIIIDKSGSMSGLESDVVGGFNNLIKEQLKSDKEVNVTTIFFDTDFHYVLKRENAKTVKKLKPSDYRPSGCTSLLDAIGNGISFIKDEYSKLDKELIPSNTIFSIMTDGLENSSREYSYSKIKEMIETQKKEGWEFIFQAANIDEVSEGIKLGIDVDDICKMDAHPEGIKEGFVVLGCAIANKVSKKKKK